MVWLFSLSTGGRCSSLGNDQNFDFLIMISDKKQNRFTEKLTSTSSDAQTIYLSFLDYH